MKHKRTTKALALLLAIACVLLSLAGCGASDVYTTGKSSLSKEDAAKDGVTFDKRDIHKG